MVNNSRIKNKFIEKVITSEEPRLACRLFEPDVKKGEKYPLVVYLHGMGERGSDTMLVLKNSGAIDFVRPEWQAKHPCYIFAPQCPEDTVWTSEEITALLVKAVAELTAQYPIDDNRVYITGLSMGGMGTWNLIAKYPHLFTAAMPICGAGIPGEILNARTLPVWAFHAADDPTVPVSAHLGFPFEGMYGTRRLVAALRGTGSRNVCYTEYPAGCMEKKYGVSPHESWVAAYKDEEALEWLFKQNRKQRYDIDYIMPGIWQIGDCWFGTHFYIVEGADKALVIDTGMVEDTAGIVKSLTRLPYELIATHVHYDHINNADQFGKFYMSKKELPYWDYYKSLLPDNTSTIDDIIGITDGYKLDLGGGVVIEAFELGGHSPGSLMLVDRYHNVCFLGDTVGNGEYAWLQVPGSLNLSEFKVNIDHFLGFLAREGLNDITFLGGHRRQEWNFPNNTRYNPMCRELLEDMSKLCTMVINDEAEISASSIIFENSKTLTAKYGMARILFQEDNKK
jgi:glyoxylase-like metal-dependent hydrolase (beta-lactamase superfamily II)/predicted esterase